MNSARRPLIAGNWKCFLGGASGVALASEVAKIAPGLPHVDLLIAPPFTALAACARACASHAVFVAGQNLYPQDSGAYTGEVSAPMLVEAGCSWVILGHSERRQIFHEPDAFIAEKVSASLAGKLLPIVCVGETLAERDAGNTLAVVERQVQAFLPILANSPSSVAIAYEPVWAIGTGKNAGPAEAQEVHGNIRAWLRKSSDGLAQRTRILYGGSVKPNNARDLLACADVDGALIGGASLDAKSFGAIAEAAEALAAR
ncbi:MAG: triose-phosphate isomerase [Polyangiaceae bacterium]